MADLGPGSSTLIYITPDISRKVSVSSNQTLQTIPRTALGKTVKEITMSDLIQHESHFRRLSWLWAYCYDQKVQQEHTTFRIGMNNVIDYQH